MAINKLSKRKYVAGKSSNSSIESNEEGSVSDNDGGIQKTTDNLLGSVPNDGDSSDDDVTDSENDEEEEGDLTSEDGGSEEEDESNEERLDNYEGDSNSDDVNGEDEDLEWETSSENDETLESDEEKTTGTTGKGEKSQTPRSDLNKDKKNRKNNSKLKTKKRSDKSDAQTETIMTAKAKSIEEKKDEYEGGDTSDEEDIRNTVGNIPMNWYDEYPHLGYDWEGKRILKPNHGDQLDYFLKRMEDPNFWRTVRDPQTGQDVVLSEKDIDLIKRLESQKIPDEAYNDYAPWIEWFTSEVMKMPLRKFPEHKRSFLPSIHERRRVAKMVHALKMGWIKPTKVLKKEEQERLKKGPQFYMLWQSDDVAEEMRRIHNHIPAPKRQLPGHSESYNPPAEYLFNDKEMKKFNREKKSLGNKKLHFIPQKYKSLREVPSYNRYIRERFLRCVDLYMCPRAIKMKLTIEPEDLIPQLPSPKDLQPFPTVMSLIFQGHRDMIRCISIEPRGQYLVSGSDDMTIKFWEVSTGRCLKTITVGGVVRSVAWCPNQALSLVAVAADRKCLLINPGLGDSLIVNKTDLLLQEAPPPDGHVPDRVESAVKWAQAEGEEWNNGIRIIINHFKELKQVTWHGRGDYFSTVMPDGANRSVLIHQLSKRRSQIPFSKSKGLVQCVLFHPVRPFFFVATQRNVRVYDLVKQEMFKKLYSSSKWISNMSIHPGGDNLLVGTYDRKVLWFDLDLSTKPYKTLRLHNTAVRSVDYHKRYPLFASVSDDRSLIISHGMVYNDLLQNALIVPLKRLSHHEQMNDFGIFDVLFHPSQPWVFTCGADGTIRLYT